MAARRRTPCCIPGRERCCDMGQHQCCAQVQSRGSSRSLTALGDLLVKVADKVRLMSVCLHRLPSRETACLEAPRVGLVGDPLSRSRRCVIEQAAMSTEVLCRSGQVMILMIILAFTGVHLPRSKTPGLTPGPAMATGGRKHGNCAALAGSYSRLPSVASSAP